MQFSVIEITIKMFHIGLNILIVNCITKNCISHTCVTWQGIDYQLPEDDTIVSKHVGV